MTDLLAKFEHVRDPVRTAHAFGIEEIVDPRDTRPLACDVSTNDSTIERRDPDGRDAYTVDRACIRAFVAASAGRSSVYGRGEEDEIQTLRRSVDRAV